MSAYIRIRGLPYSAKCDDILDFFKDVKIKDEKRGIFFPQAPNGRSNGEAFIELESSDEVDKATAHHNEHMGRRYIEVFSSTEDDMKNAMGRSNGPPKTRGEYVVRLRGLPYDTEKKEIYAFFNGLEIAPNGIGLLVDHLGRCTGEAFVQFTTTEMLSRAKEKHMEKIGHRYIEIFDSSMAEANSTIQRQMETNHYRDGSGPGPRMNRPRDGPMEMRGNYGPPGRSGSPPFNGRYPGRPGPYSRPMQHQQGPPAQFDGPGRGSMGGPMRPPFSPGPDGEDPPSMTGHSVRMRGLPFQATREEIERFLAPLQPVKIRMRLNRTGRPLGEAIIDFASHDEAKEAMKKDREKIGTRYIELFLVSTPAGTGGSRMSNPPAPYGPETNRPSFGQPSSPPFGTRPMPPGDSYGSYSSGGGGGGNNGYRDDAYYTSGGPYGEADYGPEGGYSSGPNSNFESNGNSFGSYRQPYREGQYW